MKVESKDFDKLEEKLTEGLIHAIAQDTVDKNKHVAGVLVETIARYAKSKVPAADIVQKPPTPEDFKRHISGKNIKQK
jgi:hypothetical protein